MHGEKQHNNKRSNVSPRNWLDQLKLSIINRDDKLLCLMAEEPFPHFETLEELQEAKALLSQVENIMRELSSELQTSMNNLKKMKQFDTSNDERYQHLDHHN